MKYRCHTLALALAVACAKKDEPAPSTPRTTATVEPTRDAKPTNLAPEAVPTSNPKPSVEEFISLEVQGYGSAVVAMPADVAAATTLVIATHGNYDRPEWQCEVWSEVFERKAYVLCPRGVHRRDSPAEDDPRFTYENNQALEREVDAAVSAFRQKVTTRPAETVVWAGFSLGAIMGVAIAARRPADFSNLILVEGGIDRLSDDVIKKFAKGGGKRVLLACAQAGCGKLANKRAAQLEKHGIKALVVDAGNLGHTYSGKVATDIRTALPRFLE